MALQFDFEGGSSRSGLIAKFFRVLMRRIILRSVGHIGSPANDNESRRDSESYIYVSRKRPVLRQRHIFINGKFSHSVWERER